MKSRPSARQKASDDYPSNSRPVVIPGSLGSFPIPIRISGNQSSSASSQERVGPNYTPDFTRWQSLPPDSPVLGSLRAPPSILNKMPKLALPPRKSMRVAQSCPVGVGLLGAMDMGTSVSTGRDSSEQDPSEMSALEVLGSVPLSPDILRDIPVDMQIAEFPDRRSDVDAPPTRPSETNDMDELDNEENDDVDALAGDMQLQFDLEDD